MSREGERERIIAEIKERVEDNGYISSFFSLVGNKRLLTATTYFLQGVLARNGNPRMVILEANTQRSPGWICNFSCSSEVGGDA